MIGLFRTQNPLNLLLLLAYTFVMRIAVFFQLPQQLDNKIIEPFTLEIIQLPIQNLTPLTNILLNLFLVYLQALLFNFVINRHSLLAKASYLPALMYVTGASLFLPFFELSAPLIANFLLIFIIDKLLRLAKSASAMSIMYDCGLLIALGTLIYFPFILLLLLLWISLLLYRPFYWREWLAGILGFLTIFIFVLTYFYWNDLLPNFIAFWRPLANNFTNSLRIDINDYLVLIPLGIVLILALLSLRERFYSTFISTRKAFQLLLLMFVINLCSFYTKTNVSITHFILGVAPGAVLLAFYFAYAKKKWVYESIFIVLVLCIQYFLFV